MIALWTPKHSRPRKMSKEESLKLDDSQESKFRGGYLIF
jgi:hypothetical protein